MKMTIEQFREWANSATLTASDHIDGETESEALSHYDDDGQPILKDVTFACAWRDLNGTLPDGSEVKITYQENVEWNTSPTGRTDDDYTTSPLSEAPAWLMEGLTLIDEDGDEEGNWTVQDTLQECFSGDGEYDATDIDYDALLPKVVTQDIDIDIDTEGETDMETIEVKNDNAPNIRFTGEEVAQVNSKSAYNDGGRWTVLKLYRTKSGKFICQSIGRTQWQGETDRYSAQVAEDHAGVIEFFGHGRLAKDLYREADISDVQDVD